MLDIDCDVVILGSGFGGSVMALVLERVGLKPVLVDRVRHPRFALGESSTPIADLALLQLAKRYGLPHVAPFAEYGPWQRTYPEVPCGLKRGFSYFQHVPGRPFEPRADHGNELLVAASAADEDADTHWYRAAFDAWLVDAVRSAGIGYLEETEIAEIEQLDRAGGCNRLKPDANWRVRGLRRGEEVCIHAGFAIDASGEGTVMARALHIPSSPRGFRTSSRALYGHFRNVRPWHELLVQAGARVDEHPFRCDDAALHHILDGGWMWVLRFNNGVTSAGFVLDTERWPLDQSVSPEDEWQAQLARYPTLALQFGNAELTAECGHFRRTGRLQRQAEQMAGPDWAMLPLTAYALDALHSTGNAHTLCGIERLAHILETTHPGDDRAAALRGYEAQLRSEISLLDQIVAGCYASFGDFEALAAFAMTYFAAATFSETARRQSPPQVPPAFLLADRPGFRRAVDACEAGLERHLNLPPADRAVSGYSAFVAETLAPFNVAGLCDVARRNMYPFTCNPSCNG